jgi:hypothetical protein
MQVCEWKRTTTNCAGRAFPGSLCIFAFQNQLTRAGPPCLPPVVAVTIPVDFGQNWKKRECNAILWEWVLYCRVVYYLYHTMMSDDDTRHPKWRILTPTGSLGASFGAIPANVLDASCNRSRRNKRERIFLNRGSNNVRSNLKCL